MDAYIRVPMSSGDSADDRAALLLDDWLDAFTAEPQPLSPPPGLLDDRATNVNWPTPATRALSRPSDANLGCNTPPRANAEPSRRPRRRRPSGSDTNKITLDALRLQARELVGTLALLRVRHFGAYPLPDALEAFSERRKRHCAERESEQLRQAIATQTRFLDGLRSALMPCVPNGDLCRFLHRYTRLPRDRSVRLAEYAALAHDSRLHAAREFLTRETAPIAAASVVTPFIQAALTVDSQGCAVATRAVYAFDTRDVGAVVRGVCAAVGEIVPKCFAYKTVASSRRIVDADAQVRVAAEATARRRASTTLSYSVMGFRHQSLDHDSRSSPDELLIESRVVVQVKQTDCASARENDGEVVVLWDFVDDDELHPTAATVDITRQCIGACFVRRERCDDGIERVVYRSMSSRLYRFRDDPTQTALVRFVGITEGAMKTHELLFRAIVTERLAAQHTQSAAIDQD